MNMTLQYTYQSIAYYTRVSDPARRLDTMCLWGFGRQGYGWLIGKTLQQVCSMYMYHKLVQMGWTIRHLYIYICKKPVFCLLVDDITSKCLKSQTPSKTNRVVYQIQNPDPKSRSEIQIRIQIQNPDPKSRSDIQISDPVPWSRILDPHCWR
jgi:hypothetical protein